jgi:predicted methyltransferase
MVALQSPGIEDAVAMLAAGAKLGGESTVKANYADSERLVRSVEICRWRSDQAAYISRATRAARRSFSIAKR